uniref:Uncharacterized protein n=1 Tax=Ornithorhynchus anatinus TaxID=9258 RepID=A0A6I8PHC9_ORNAN
IEAIFSAADTGFNGSLVEGFPVLTSPAAYMGTITGCFLLLTIFRVSIPKEHKSFLLLWEPPHWYFNPYASWISCSSVHTSSISYPLSVEVSLVLSSKFSNNSFREVTFSSAPETGIAGKQASNIRCRRLINAAYIYI